MQDHDHDYYRRRAETERRRAEETADPAAAMIHRELAARYAERSGPPTSP